MVTHFIFSALILWVEARQRHDIAHHIKEYIEGSEQITNAIPSIVCCNKWEVLFMFQYRGKKCSVRLKAKLRLHTYALHLHWPLNISHVTLKLPIIHTSNHIRTATETYVHSMCSVISHFYVCENDPYFETMNRIPVMMNWNGREMCALNSWIEWCENRMKSFHFRSYLFAFQKGFPVSFICFIHHLVLLCLKWMLQLTK